MVSRSCSFVAALAFLAAGCGSFKRPAQVSSAFDAWADSFAADWVRASPQLANRLKYFTGGEQDALDRQLSLIGEWDYPYGRRGFGIRAALAKRGLAEIDAMDPRTLSHDQQTTAAIIRWTVQDQLASGGFPLHRYIFDQFNGLQLDMVNHFAQAIGIHTPRDVENHLAALTQVAPRLDEGIDRIYDRPVENRGVARESARGDGTQILNPRIPQRVLRSGSVPLNVLEQNVNEWIAAAR